MAERRRAKLVVTLWALLAICLEGSGCQHQQLLDATASRLPHELDKVSLPPYVIEPPDLLQLDALTVVPLPPYRVEPLDTLLFRVLDADPKYPIEGIYQVDPDGTVNLGIPYGRLRVVGMTLDEIKNATERHLKDIVGIKAPLASVTLYQSRGLQQIRGEHLVRPDGTISLGTYGSAYVTGMTIEEAKKAVEAQLSKTLLQPDISLDILAYNSKVFYIVTDGGGNGETSVRQPITGNETVLDALSNVGGLAPQASKKHIWIARPTPADSGHGVQILPVDWNAIVQCGKTATNYQILPGDRIYVKANPLVTADTLLGRIIQPVERAFGVTLLGQETIRIFERGRGTGTGTGTGF